jgi:hypothetical protein
VSGGTKTQIYTKKTAKKSKSCCLSVFLLFQKEA